MIETTEAISPYPKYLDHQVRTEVSDLSPEVRAELTELRDLNLPNLYETVLTGALLHKEGRDSMRPQHVRPPLPGRYTNRQGERINRSELLPIIDRWTTVSQGKSRFVVQGGNRYISDYLEETGIKAGSLKIMSLNKAPLYNQLLTLLTPLEREAPCKPEVLNAISALLPETTRMHTTPLTRAQALKYIADETAYCPFESITKDENLHTEFAEAVRLIDTGTMSLPNIDGIKQLLEGTELHEAFSGVDELHFLDDLFYRGRTLYSLAAVVTAFGGNAKAIRLTCISCDTKSKDITSAYHQILDSGRLYPFENSIRTEQGYWQDIGDRHIFTDMGNYWDYLHSQTDNLESQATYIAWQSKIRSWYEKHTEGETSGADMTLIGPLVWLQIYHEIFGLDLNIEKIIDQKGYKVGACVPFAQIIDRFVSQEESVETRLAFKSEIKAILRSIQSVNAHGIDGLQELKAFYNSNRRSIDYHGLSFILEEDILKQLEPTKSPEYMDVVSILRNRIVTGALNHSGPYVVGINGVDTSGKTEMSKELEISLIEGGIEVCTVHFDTFTNPKADRLSGTDPIDNYLNHTFDYEALRRHILQPILAGQLPQIVLNHVDSRSDSKMVEHTYNVAGAPSVVIVEGVFLFRQELQDYFNLKIFIDIPIATMSERAISRDVLGFGFGALTKFLKKYIPAQEQYLQTVQPHAIADIIVDNNDWTKPTITKGYEQDI